MQLDIDAAMVLIKSNKRVVVVGLSPKEDRPSHRVGKFLIEKGFVVTPINPGQDEILGQECKKSLAELQTDDVDWIDMFVSPARLNDFYDDIVRLAPKLVWCQIGVVDDEFNRKLEERSAQCK